MATLTPELIDKTKRAIRSILKKRQNLFDDALQEGLIRILEMEEGQTDSYYTQGAVYRVRDWLKKENKHQGREITSINLEEVDDIYGLQNINDHNKRISVGKDKNVLNAMSQNDLMIEEYLNGRDYGDK